MLTADTITDEQIRELRSGAESRVTSTDAVERDQAFEALLCSGNALFRNLDTSGADGKWTHWRRRCAEIINARASGAITADTITSAQIREAQDIAPERIGSEIAADALGLPPGPNDYDKPHHMIVEARARCAEILNQRAPEAI